MDCPYFFVPSYTCLMWLLEDLKSHTWFILKSVALHKDVLHFCHLLCIRGVAMLASGSPAWILQQPATCHHVIPLSCFEQSSLLRSPSVSVSLLSLRLIMPPSCYEIPGLLPALPSENDEGLKWSIILVQKS